MEAEVSFGAWVARRRKVLDLTRQLRVELEAQLTPQQIEMAQASAQAKSFDALVTELLNTFPRAI